MVLLCPAETGEGLNQMSLTLAEKSPAIVTTENTKRAPSSTLLTRALFEAKKQNTCKHIIRNLLIIHTYYMETTPDHYLKYSGLTSP